MNDQKATCLKYLYGLMTKIIDDNYDKNYFQFEKENQSLNLFLNKNVQLFSKKYDINLINSLISEEDYRGILNYIKNNNKNAKKEQIQVRNIISNDINFISIYDLNVNALSPHNKKIYNEAIQIINHKYSDNEMFVGMKNDNLVRIIKDKKGNVKSWIVDKKGKIIQNSKDNENNILISTTDNTKISFSNALILSFIIGSFIGILFLSLYIKFLK